MKARQIDITKEDVRCCDELMIEDDHINATYELWFEHFKYFGVKEPYDVEDLSYVNFYTDWYPDGTIKASYTVYSDEDYEYGDDWELTDEEKEFFRQKMEDYCQYCDDMSLMELWEEYNEE